MPNNVDSGVTEGSFDFIIFLIQATLVMVAGIVGIAVYVMISFALSILGERKRLDYLLLAWIPLFGQLYILGKIVRDVDISKYNVNKLEFTLPIIAIVAALMLKLIPIIGILVFLALYVFTIFVLKKLYKMYAPEKVVLYTVLSALGLFVIPLLKIRELDSKEVPSVGKPVFK